MDRLCRPPGYPGESPLVFITICAVRLLMTRQILPATCVYVSPFLECLKVRELIQ